MDTSWNFIQNNVLYICQSGTSGYANAAKGYLYELLNKKITVKSLPFACDNSHDVETTAFDEYIGTTKSTELTDPEVSIIHSTPDLWSKIISDLNIKSPVIIGRTVWELEKLVPEWVDSINSSNITHVSVPTLWNKKTFIQSGVKKPILVDPHIYVDYPFKEYTLEYLLKNKSIILMENDTNHDVVNDKHFKDGYIFYSISQFTDRKGITDLIKVFCETYTDKDNVILLLKTFRDGYSEEEQNKCIFYISEAIRSCNNKKYAPIIYIKDNLNFDEIKSLHNIGDCYISLPKAEGFGLGIYDAYNLHKRIIVTGFGGHVEYLGPNYIGLVGYKLTSFDKKLFPRFDFDDTYKWANVNLNDASKLMINHSNNKLTNFSKKHPILFDGGIYEKEWDGYNYYSWVASKLTLYVLDVNIKSLILHFVAVFNGKIVVNDTSYEFLIGFNKIEIKKTNEILKLTQSHFIPSITFNDSDDTRELSYKLYKIELKHSNDTTEILNIDTIKYISPEQYNNIKDNKLEINSSLIQINNEEYIKYIGQTGTSGYASAAKGYIADYVIKNTSITWQQLKFDDSNNDLDYYVDVLAESAVNKKFKMYDKLILHSTPDLWRGFIKENQNISRIIGYCTWESNKMPLKWVNNINLVEEVWVPSNFNKRTFIDSGVKCKIKVVPHIWHPQKLINKSNIRIYDYCKNEVPNHKFTFYSIGELNFRKGIEDLVKVFDKFNDKYENTQLILKLHYKGYTQESKNKCISDIQKFTTKVGTSIFLIMDHLSNKDILTLHSFGDCYVSLTKGEGFGLTIFDAYNLGKKVITTGYGGSVDFLGTDYNGLVKYKIDKVYGMETFSTNYTEDQKWAYPDLDHAYKLMEKSYKKL